ncbi:glycosyltransferase [Prochlorococcus marinus]|uniref:Glycosyl transferase n=1 Tax=Prochlorococcus marinus str. SB TaxID=59926 RepID=A0A0A2B5F9_PROMR|nr:glycosyltransferase [Prochlorococcus marinus]KGG09056.1 Glycosyl transferase [Prochlorococcus marinus str. SB]
MSNSNKYKSRPKLTIITICKNSEKTISDAVKSVLDILNIAEGIEYIIQDGKSRDDTNQIIKELTKDNNKVKIYRETDKGIYDAMNKALDKAKGEFILFLNSDDILLNNFLKKSYVDIFKSDFDCLIAPVMFFKRPSKRILRYWLVKEGNLNFISSLIYSPYPPHPGFICKRKILSKYKFNLKYNIASDYLQMNSILKDSSVKRKYLERPIVAMAMNGESNRIRSIIKSKKEINQINKKIKFSENIALRYIRNLIQHIIPLIKQKKLMDFY